MGFFDVMLLKSDLNKQGVDKAALFSDPESYLAEKPLVLKSVRPWPMAILYFLVLSLVPFLLVTYVDMPISESMAFTVQIMGLGLGILSLLMLLVLLPKQELTVDPKGITIRQRGKVLHAPWEVFDVQGQSGLKSPTIVKIPINITHIDAVSLSDSTTTVQHGEQINVPFFKWELKKEMVSIQNLYALTAADMAEMIRRIALTIGHQQPV